MRFKALAGLVVAVTAAALAVGVTTRPPTNAGGGAPGECTSSAPPLGALPPARPAWCGGLGTAVDTAIRTANGWSDGFISGAMHARLPDSYRLFEHPRGALGRGTSVYRTQQFAHNGHWMADVGGRGSPPGVYEGSAIDFFTGPNNGGALMRPDAGFTFANDLLVIEFDASAGMATYGDRVWPEIVVTTAPAPSDRETNGWYAAGLFGGYPAVGCSFPSDRLSECRVYDEEKITANLNSNDSAGASFAFGGAPATAALDRAWRVCGPTQPDAECRDRFRIEFARDAVTIFVNGVRYMEHRGLPPDRQLPDPLLRSTVYVYFASWAYLAEPTVARVHWGRIAVNPDALMR